MHLYAVRREGGKSERAAAAGAAAAAAAAVAAAAVAAAEDDADAAAAAITHAGGGHSGSDRISGLGSHAVHDWEEETHFPKFRPSCPLRAASLGGWS